VTHAGNRVRARGQKAAIAAAKLGKRVCLAERRNMMGGVCVNTGTIPSKTLREAVLYLTGFTQRDMYGELPGQSRDHDR
jgi:NAD(P) transhydrogenase